MTRWFSMSSPRQRQRRWHWKQKNPFNSSTFNILLFVSCAIGVFIISFSYLSVCTLPLSHMRNPFCFQKSVFVFTHCRRWWLLRDSTAHSASERDEERKVGAHVACHDCSISASFAARRHTVCRIKPFINFMIILNDNENKRKTKYVNATSMCLRVVRNSDSESFHFYPIATVWLGCSDGGGS